MTRRYAPTRPSSVNDLQIAKARLRVASIQAAPTELIRRHPWSSVLGTFAGAIAIAGLFGGRTKKIVTVDGKEQRVGTGLHVPPGAWSALMHLGSQMLHTYLTKQAVEKATEQATGNDDPGQCARGNTAREDNGHAVG